MARMSLRSLTRVDVLASLGMFSYASSVVVTPIILVRLAEELHFGLAAGGGIEAVRAGFLLAVLVASGAAALRFGKVTVLAAGGVVLGVGLFGYALAPVYLAVLVTVVLVGVGGGILEALLNPLVQEEHPDDSGRYLNIVNAFFSVGIVISVLLVGELLTRGVSWRILVAIVGSFATITGVLFIPLARAHQRQRGERDEPELSQGSREIMGDRRFWLFAVAMFCGGGAEGGFTFWTASYVQLHFDALARGGAIATAVFSSGMVVGRLASGHVVSQRRLHHLIVGSALIGVAASLGAWAATGLIAFMAVTFVAGLSIACFWPSIQSHAAARMPTVDATTLFILLSVGGIPGFGLTSWSMGIVAEVFDLRASLLVLPVLLAVLSIVMIIAERSSMYKE